MALPLCITGSIETKEDISIEITVIAIVFQAFSIPSLLTFYLTRLPHMMSVWGRFPSRFPSRSSFTFSLTFCLACFTLWQSFSQSTMNGFFEFEYRTSRAAAVTSTQVQFCTEIHDFTLKVHDCSIECCWFFIEKCLFYNKMKTCRAGSARWCDLFRSI